MAKAPRLRGQLTSSVRRHNLHQWLLAAPIQQLCMASNSVLQGTVLELLSGIGVLRQRKMFGGVYIYCDDLFIATIHDGALYFKANSTTAADFVARGLPVFSYPKEGGIATLQYYQAPPEVFTEPTAMKFWADKALLAARQDSSAKVRKSGRASKKSVAPCQQQMSCPVLSK